MSAIWKGGLWCFSHFLKNLDPAFIQNTTTSHSTGNKRDRARRKRGKGKLFKYISHFFVHARRTLQSRRINTKKTPRLVCKVLPVYSRGFIFQCTLAKIARVLGLERTDRKEVQFSPSLKKEDVVSFLPGIFYLFLSKNMIAKLESTATQINRKICRQWLARLKLNLFFPVSANATSSVHKIVHQCL